MLSADELQAKLDAFFASGGQVKKLPITERADVKPTFEILPEGKAKPARFIPDAPAKEPRYKDRPELLRALAVLGNATTAEIHAEMGGCRKSVQRDLGCMIKAGKVKVVGHIQSGGGGIYALSEGIPTPPAPTSRQRILAYIEGHRATTCPVIAEHIGLSLVRTAAIVRSLVDDGHVTVIGRAADGKTYIYGVGK